MKKRSCGLTLIEVVIASVILVAVSAMAMQILYMTTNQVTNSEVGVRLEQSAREVISQMSSELRQTKMVTVQIVNTHIYPFYTGGSSTSTSLLTNATTLPGSGTTAISGGPSYSTFSAPYTAALPYYTSGYSSTSGGIATVPVGQDYRSDITPWYVGTPVWGVGNFFNGIRFSIPSHQMDLTTLNANADGTNPNDNFNLTNFKSNPLGGDWLVEIQYWWEPDIKNADGSPMSAGVIKRTQATWDSKGNFLGRKYAIVAKNVASLTMGIRRYPGFVVPNNTTNSYPQFNTQAQATPYIYTSGSNIEKQIDISIVMQEPDPKYPKQNIIRSLNATVDVRN